MKLVEIDSGIQNLFGETFFWTFGILCPLISDFVVLQWNPTLWPLTRDSGVTIVELHSLRVANVNRLTMSYALQAYFCWDFPVGVCEFEP